MDNGFNQLETVSEEHNPNLDKWLPPIYFTRKW
jgi:hypothetical protein